MSLALTNRLSLLQDRAAMLASARQFFAKRNILEVDVPSLSKSGSVDVHIDLIQASCMNEQCFLHSSPEYGMKRLLAEGIGDIYQLSHVFREGERGKLHNPEFTMAEWYRIGFTFEQMIEETLQFCHLFFDFSLSYEKLGYKEAFFRYLGHYPETAAERDYHFAFEIEPHLGRGKPTVIIGFPKEQAALSQIGKDGLSERFEVYFSGFELANGYHELLDPKEQRIRLEEANKERIRLQKKPYPVDEQFLAALEEKIPDCCGVACGFDRLMMLRHNVEIIDEVIPFTWENV